MRMKTRDLLFIAIVLVAVGGLYYLSTKGRIKPMPANPAHLTAKTRDECLVCHTAQQMLAAEQARKHPGKWRDERVSCVKCHTAPQATADISNLKLNISDSEGALWPKPKQN